MRVREILEATKKYVDKDGKVVHRILRPDIAPTPLIKPEPSKPPRNKKAPRPWPDNPFATPSDLYLYDGCNYPAPIRRRKKNEPLDMDKIRSFGFISGDKDGNVYDHGADGRGKELIATYKVVGKTYKQNPMTELWHECETLVVKFIDGSIVPATRLGPSNVLVQDMRFKGKINFLGGLYDGDDEDLVKRLKASRDRRQ